MTVSERLRCAREHVMHLGANCGGCPYDGLQRGPVLSSEMADVSRVKLIVLGGAPGGEEVSEGAPFVGGLGRRIREWIGYTSLQPDEVTYLNAISCQPPGRETHDPKAITNCYPRFANELGSYPNARSILTIGEEALNAAAHHFGAVKGGTKKKLQPGQFRVAKLGHQRGHPIVVSDSMTVIPTTWPIHDAKEYWHVIQDEIEMAAKAANGKLDIGIPSIRITPEELFSKISYERPAIVDIESANLSINTPILCIGFAIRENGTIYTASVELQSRSGVLFRHALDTAFLARLRRVLDEAPLVFQNGAFDTERLLRHGYMTRRERTWFDTCLQHHCTMEQDLAHNLGFITSRFAAIVLWKGDVDHKAVDNETPYEDLLKYCEQDCAATLVSFEHLEPLIRNRDIYEHDCRKAIIARNMGSLGMFADMKTFREIDEQVVKSYEENLEALQRVTKVSTFNPNSTKDVRQYLFEMKGLAPVLSTKGYTFGEDEEAEEQDPGTAIPALCALEDQGVDADTSNVIKLIIKCRKRRTLKGTYINGLLKLMIKSPWPDIMEAHPGFNTQGTATGRFSSSQPNAQNWPSQGPHNMHKIFIAPPGHVIVAADFKQLEARIYAAESRDAKVLEVIEKGLDLHAMNWAAMNAKNPVEMDRIYEETIKWKDDESDLVKHRAANFGRLAAKNFFFQLIYGAGEDGLYASMKYKIDKNTDARVFPRLSAEQVREWYESFHRLHPEQKRWQKMINEALQDHGYIADGILGRRRYFPAGRNANGEFMWAASKVDAPANMKIQGDAAALADRAIMEIDRQIPYREWSPFSGVYSQIHDAIYAYAPIERAEEAKQIFSVAMSSTYKGVPMEGDIKISERW